MIFYPDLNPTATSNTKDIQVKSLIVKNADGTSTITKAVLPADATLLGISVSIPVGTATATLSVGKIGTPNFFIGATALGAAGQFWPIISNIGNLSSGGYPLGQDLRITTTVGTTAVTSDVYVNIYYVR